jgi:hypothetical protein
MYNQEMKLLEMYGRENQLYNVYVVNNYIVENYYNVSMAVVIDIDCVSRPG